MPSSSAFVQRKIFRRHRHRGALKDMDIVVSVIRIMRLQEKTFSNLKEESTTKNLILRKMSTKPYF